jgi:hypothetical protein
MKKLVKVVDASEHRIEVEKRVVNSVKSGRCNSRTIRTDKIVEFAFYVEIDWKQGITHSLERKRVRDALRAKMSGEFNDVKRRSDGTYIFNVPTVKFEFVAKLEDGSSVHLGTDKNAAKRAGKLAIARETRVVGLLKEAA